MLCSKLQMVLYPWMELYIGGGVMAPLNNFFKKISILIGTNLVILFNKITFSPLNNVINSFKINVIATNFFTIFLQSIEVANF